MILQDLFALKPLIKFLFSIVAFVLALRNLWKHPLAGPWFVVRFILALITYVVAGMAGVFAVAETAHPPAPANIALAAGVTVICWILFSGCLLVSYLHRMQSVKVPKWLLWSEAALLSGVCAGVIYVVVGQPV